MYYFLKLFLSAAIIVAVSELGKRSALMGAALASLPLISILAFIWLYYDTGDVEKVMALSKGIFWLILPSLTLFILLPVLIRQGVSFYLSLLITI